MRKGILYFSIMAMIFLSSCAIPYRYIYTATPPNNPYFIKKGESKFAGYYSSAWNNGDPSTRRAGGWDFQSAYAVGNHWAFTAGYLNRSEIDGYSYNDNTRENTFIKYRRNLFDLGSGYFLALDNKKEVTINLYGGVALGKYSFTDEEYERFIRVPLPNHIFNHR